jgi:cytochrome c-type biogenesis protein CcmF
VWTAIQPDIGPLRRLIDGANTRFASASANVQALVVAGLVAHYEGKPLPATFRFIVSPLVEWIWLGGLVVLFGGLIAIWPAAAPAEARAKVARVLRRRGVDRAPAPSSATP